MGKDESTSTLTSHPAAVSNNSETSKSRGLFGEFFETQKIVSSKKCLKKLKLHEFSYNLYEPDF